MKKKRMVAAKFLALLATGGLVFQTTSTGCLSSPELQTALANAATSVLTELLTSYVSSALGGTTGTAL